MSALLVFIGAGIGGVLRHGVNLAGARYAMVFPWSTFAVNVIGSLAMGLVMGVLLRRGGPAWSAGESWRLFLGTGVLGGFTTFSAFSLDLARLLDQGAIAAALGYALGSVVVSLAALYVGTAIARAF